jgi:hypothetical protein
MLRYLFFPSVDFLTDLGAWSPSVQFQGRRLPTSSGKAINVLQGAYHAAITQAMANFNTDNSKNIENIETKGTISLVDEYEMRSEKDASRTNSGVIDGKHDECGQNMNLTGSKEDQTSATKDHTVEIVVSDDEEYTIDNVLPDSRHGYGSIYRDMDGKRIIV